MAKIYPQKPFLLLFYGYPGSGKTYFARQFTSNVQAAHIQADRIRMELFEQPRYDQQENTVVKQLMDYMTEEFLAAGLSVAYDINAARYAQRRSLSDMAFRHGAQPLLVWFQMDLDTAFTRNVKRDRRRADDKFASSWDRTTYENIISHMQNPRPGEDYVVVSGKHLFNMQQSAVISKLRTKGVLGHDDANSRVIKPGLVNLVPSHPTRYDLSRRNISIRS
ncbi:MAG TPA: ATP-binding protein [Candidatus Saccharimonadales bacterium]|nr:ATP-binding protein [Candidatus Saccharimonadales bacterium]